MTMIDMNRPVEAVRKSDGKVVPLGMPKPTEYNGGRVTRFATETAPCPDTSNELWYADGRNYCYLNQWTVRNVPVATLGTQLRHAYFTATVFAVAPNGDLMVETKGTSPSYYRLDAATLTDTDGDTWVIVEESPTPPPSLPVYRNIYADGTIGRTAHETRREAMLYSTYGKVRVGVLTQRTEDGEVVGAFVTSTEPQLRTRDGVTNPFA